MRESEGSSGESVRQRQLVSTKLSQLIESVVEMWCFERSFSLF